MRNTAKGRRPHACLLYSRNLRRLPSRLRTSKDKQGTSRNRLLLATNLNSSSRISENGRPPLGYIALQHRVTPSWFYLRPLSSRYSRERASRPVRLALCTVVSRRQGTVPSLPAWSPRAASLSYRQARRDRKTGILWQKRSKKPLCVAP